MGMSVFSRISHNAGLIGMFMAALLVVPPVGGQVTSDQILYAVGNGNENTDIYTLNLNSDVKTKVGTVHAFGSDAGWSPNGQLIYLFDYDGANQRTLTLVDVETNHRQTIPDQLDGDRCSLPFWWSPDGELLAYAAQAEPQALLKVINISNGDIQTLTNADPLFSEISWSYDGHYLAYRVDSKSPDQNYDFAIWDVQERKTVLTLDVASSDEFPMWSPTENRIVYGAPDSSYDMIYNLTDGTKQQYTSGRPGQWSPDGHFVTIYTGDANDNSLLSIIDVVAHTSLALDEDISKKDVDFKSAWSFDGRYLALATIDHANDYKKTIYVVDVSDGSSSRLTADPLFFDNFKWSPMGNGLGFASHPTNGDGNIPFTSLWLFDIDRKLQQKFEVEASPNYFRPSLNWSADGRYMLVWTPPSIALFDKESSQLTPIAESLSTIALTRWSPDGTKIALPARSPTFYDLFVFTTENGSLMNITNTTDENETFLGWRGTKHNDSLIFCGEG